MMDKMPMIWLAEVLSIYVAQGVCNLSDVAHSQCQHACIKSECFCRREGCLPQLNKQMDGKTGRTKMLKSVRNLMGEGEGHIYSMRSPNFSSVCFNKTRITPSISVGLKSNVRLFV